MSTRARLASIPSRLRALPPYRRVVALIMMLAGLALLGLVASSLFGIVPGPATMENLLLLSLAAFMLILLALGLATGQLRFQGSKEEAVIAAGWNALPAATLVSRRDGRPLLANAAWYALLARAGRHRLRPVEYLFAGSPELAARIYRLQQRLKNESEVSEELRITPGELLHPGGDAPAWLRVSARIIECDGQPCELWQVEDVTSQRAAQEEAMTRLRRTITMIDELPAGIVVADGAGQVKHVNATLSRWLGLEQAQLPGTLELADILPEDLTARLETLQGAPGTRLVSEHETVLRLADGGSRRMRVLYQAQFDMDGRRTTNHTLLVPVDEARGELLEQVERLIAAAPVGIALVDDEGRLKFLNAALAQAAAGRLGISDHVSRLVAPGDVRKLTSALDSVLSGQRPKAQLEVYLFEPDSTRAQITILPGPVGGAVLYVLDTTLRQTLMEQIEHGQIMQQIGMMASQLAHDFNNLLTPIMGSADLLLQRMRVTDPNYELVHNIKSRSWDAARIVEQLLAFSRRQTLQPEVIAVNDWLMREARLLRSMLKNRNVELKTEFGPDLWPVKVDPRKLGRVIVNLVRNAEDVMPDGGTITIRTRNVPERQIQGRLAEVMAVGDYVLIEVEDTGEGIPEEIREKIFEPFFTTKPMGKGTGLGLSTVYGIVKQSGGYVFCDSEVGVGTTFRIYLPRYVESEEERRQRLAEEEERRRRQQQDLTGSGVILLAEDEDPVREFAVHALKMRGYTVLAAPSAELALDIMEERLAAGQNVDLIVSDVVMPGMDGPTMVRKLREMGVKAPVVFMSGHAEDNFAQNLDEDFTFVFLSKPFDLRTIAEAVKEALSGGGKRRGPSDAGN